MRRALMIISVVLLCYPLGAKAQDTGAFYQPHIVINRGVGIVTAVVLLEGVAGMYSYVASKPEWYGDKIMGCIYAGASAGLIAVGVSEYIHNKGDRHEQICGSILYAGISYGLSRLAVYNLIQARGKSFEARFGRNFIEFNAAYLAPFLLYGLSEVCFRNINHRKDGKTSVYFTGRGIMIAMNL